MTRPSSEPQVKRPYPRLREAAQALRDGAEITPEVRSALAYWLDAEAAVLGEMEPFSELINAAISSAGGPESYITFGRREDGKPAMYLDTSGPAGCVADAVLAVDRGSSDD